MKIVIFGDALTYPPKEGITEHVFNLLGALSTTVGVEPVLVMSDRGFIQKSQLAKFGWDTILIPPDKFYDYPAMALLLDDLKPDIIQSYNVYQARLIGAPYSIERRVPLVMEHHDIEADLSTFLKLPTEIADENITSQTEVAKIAALNRVMSSHDYNVLVGTVTDIEEKTIQIPVGIKSFTGMDRAGLSGNRNVLFVGNCAYPPNRRALDEIINQIAPNAPEATFHVVGRLTDEIIGDKHPNIRAYGMVDDLTPILKICDVGIVPIAAGSGMKIKILTYINAGLPVIGTPVSFEGFSNQPFLIKSDLDNFHENIYKLLHSAEYQKISNSAKSFFTKNYEIGVTAEKIVEAYKKLSGVPAHIPPTFSSIKRDDSKLAWVHELREDSYPSVEDVTYIKGAR